MKTIAIYSLLFAVFLIAPGQLPAQQEGEVIGSVRTVGGSAFVLREDIKIPAHIKLQIRQNDVLLTGADGSLGVILRDDSVISIGPNSELEIDEYLFSPADNKFRFLTNMVKGTAVYLSGEIGKIAPDSVRMKTPVGSIGIRGTKFLVGINVP